MCVGVFIYAHTHTCMGAHTRVFIHVCAYIQLIVSHTFAYFLSFFFYLVFKYLLQKLYCLGGIILKYMIENTINVFTLLISIIQCGNLGCYFVLWSWDFFLYKMHILSVQDSHTFWYFQGRLEPGRTAPWGLRNVFSALSVQSCNIYEALCFDVTQDRLNGASNETQTHSCRFSSQAC